MSDKLFFVGMKGSGSTLLTRFLNKHPDICIANESDTIWLLYQLEYCGVQRTEDFKKFYEDGDEGLLITLKNHPDIIENFKKFTPQECFHLIHDSNHKIVGDKKPHQQTNPEILKYTLSLFPDAKFIHIIRHPKAIVCGKSRSNQFSRLHRLERCVKNERIIRSMHNVLTVRYEDLCLFPNKIMDRLFTFLNVEPLAVDYSKLVYLGRNDKYKSIEVPYWFLIDGIMELLDRYQYVWDE